MNTPDDEKFRGFTAPQWLMTNTLTRDRVLEYFMMSDFYDTQAENNLTEKHIKFGIDTREMDGYHYDVTYASPDNQIFHVSKKVRMKGLDRTEQVFYIIAGTIYQAPGWRNAVRMRVAESLRAMDRSLDALRSISSFSVASGHSWSKPQEPLRLSSSQGGEGKEEESGDVEMDGGGGGDVSGKREEQMGKEEEEILGREEDDDLIVTYVKKTSKAFDIALADEDSFLSKDHRRCMDLLNPVLDDLRSRWDRLRQKGVEGIPQGLAERLNIQVQQSGPLPPQPAPQRPTQMPMSAVHGMLGRNQQQGGGAQGARPQVPFSPIQGLI
uniref:Mediator of RNA polymerase II transcription subunit 6 n=1 Tax=Chromera velia CCMP2878 TaxID=1169474 RepID=A0A0G4FX98_9ALVE|eukprot:Cvel_19237.t1-p1 / transcript=Cvel_19237.t1 / gene=Cvel_19237 / organism=Chromera_velia_CCMP2878 / gene_product=Putative mediator of RNA polymerase II, putative / transcript_product=Putative mediator of RNA polymerase II, putative / location=Cvel_scaffold1645:14663-18193(-) / protein_length=324 / sequence_SO=supercontig / SO=protein_coding / is_pseudo=false